MFKKLSSYFWNILIAIDQLANAFLGGDPDETISSRAGKRRKESKIADNLCHVLDAIDPNHCANSIEDDEGQNASF